MEPKFFSNMKDAVACANQMTLSAQEQHSAVIIPRTGWLVQNVVSKTFYDADGKIVKLVV